MLKQYLFNPGTEYHVRGLVREMKEEINAVRRELGNLEEAGILKSQKRGNKLVYSLDPSCPILNELTSMLYKDRDDIKEIMKTLRKIQVIGLAVLTKNYLTGEYPNSYDIDLLLVGDIEPEAVLHDFKKLEEKLEKSLRYSLMKKSDLEFQLKKRDVFIQNILQNDHIILKGSEKDLA
ncbi:hypothetical protein H6764_03025 [Candidatus Nomurabacteria bacterium]|nr:hypothetical protein [Candidatus Nomurabacteria bacterium]